jgi:hypothetical protein
VLFVVHWLVAGSPTPDPTITPGTTTPIQDVLHQAQLDFLITIGALLATAANIVGVYRTLIVATRARRTQSDLIRMAHESYVRQMAVLEFLHIPDPVGTEEDGGDATRGTTT